MFAGVGTFTAMSRIIQRCDLSRAEDMSCNCFLLLGPSQTESDSSSELAALTASDNNKTSNSSLMVNMLLSQIGHIARIQETGEQ